MTRSYLALGVFFVATTALFAGQQAQPVFRTGVDLIHFDVSVLDKNRQPVRGLTAADFTVLEDGKPQPIAAFSAVDVPPPAPPPPAKWMREVSPDVRSNDTEQNPEGRLFVLLIDDAMLPGDPAAIQNAKKIAHGVIDRLSPSDQVAVVFSFASGNAQTFTTDRKKLRAAIDGLKSGAASHLLGWDNTVPFRRTPPLVGPSNPASVEIPPTPVVDSDIGLRLGALRTLQMVAETLIASPQRRKALIYVSPGITVDMESDAKLVKIIRGSTDPGTALREANHQLAREMPNIFLKMSRANVTVYSIDPCGLGGLEAYVAGAAGNLRALRNGISPGSDYNWLAPDNPPLPSDLARHTAQVNMDFLMAAAANTGGRAVVNTNDFNPGLDGIFSENASYYLIGYSKPAKSGSGDVRKVTVKVNRPGVTVRTRSGYDSAETRPSAKTEPIAAALADAVGGPVANGALPLQMALAPVAVPGAVNHEAAVVIVLGIEQAPVSARTSQVVHLQTGIFTPDGRRIGALQRQTATFTLVPGGGKVLRYELLTRASVSPGRYEVRVAAFRASDGLSGSVYADVVVPEFSKARVSLSGVWLEANPGPSAVPKDALASLLPIVPTASREFGRNDEVSAFFRVYQGGDAALAPVTLALRIVDEHDVTLTTASGPIGAERFDPVGRAADHRFLVPLRSVPPGRYLLSFDVTLGEASARRDVVFQVR